jgi:hypothetical protein
MAMTEDMTAFFNTAEHAVSALWKGTTTVSVIFDNEFAQTLDAEGSNPVVLVPTADMPNVARDEALVIDSVNYTIYSIQPDGTGITRLELQKA